MIFKNFRHKKMQITLIFLIIMLCSMLLSASVSILISLEKPYYDFAEECNSPDAIMFPYSQKSDAVIAFGKQLAKLDQVERVEYKKYHYITEELSIEGKKLEGFLKLTEYNETLFGKARYTKGDSTVAANLKDNECFIPICISIDHGIDVGDTLVLKCPGNDVTLTVKGIFSETYNTSSAFSSDILINKVPDFLDVGMNVAVFGKNGATGRQIEEAYRMQNDGQMPADILTLEARISNGLITGKVIGAVFLAIGIIMLLVSCLIINFMIRNAMITDAKKIAIYKTMGYTSGDILKMYISFYFIVVTIACLIGIACSVFISKLILNSVFETMGKLPSTIELLPGLLSYLSIAGLVTVIIYLIIGKTKKMKPVFALNGMLSTGTKKSNKYKGNSRLQFSPLGIALRTISRSKKGTIGVILTSIITIFGVNFAAISLDIANTMKENNDYWVGVDKCDVMIGVTGTTNYELVKKAIKDDSRVRKYLSTNYDADIMMRWKKGMETTVMKAFVYDDFSQADIPIIEGRNPMTSNEIAISSKMAEELKKEIGDYLEVYLNGQKRVDLLITGLFQSYNEFGNCCRLTTDVYRANNYPIEYNQFSIYLNNHADIDSFIKDIRAKVGGSGNVFERTEAYSSIMDMIVTPQKNAVPPVVGLVLLIGGINIFCIVMLKNANSEKTNGIYKCIGYSTVHLVLSNIYYIAVIAITAILIALPMTLALYSRIMRICLGVFGFRDYPVSIEISHLVSVNLLIMVLFAISTLLSSKSLRNVNVRDLVQE